MEELINEGALEEINVGAIEKFLDELPYQVLRLGMKVLLALLVLFIGIQLIKLIRKILKKALQHGKVDKGVIQFTDSFVKIALYVVLLVLIASSFGLDATSVIAVLGSAGVTIGLALQGSLSNFAGGVLILIIKPFVVGDYIMACGEEGTVTTIEMCYTKLTTIDDRIVVLPNGTLANTTIINNTTTPLRRLDFNISIAYDANIGRAKDILYDILHKEDFVLKDNELLVYVNELAAHSVDLGVRCYVKNEDYIRSKGILLEKIKLAFDENQIVIPFEQLDVHLDK